MDKYELAEELRQRQYQKGMKKELVESLTDNEIINSYILCSDCGKKKVDDEDLRNVIKLSHNVGQFLKLCDFVEYLRFFELHPDEVDENEPDDEDWDCECSYYDEGEEDEEEIDDEEEEEEEIDEEGFKESNGEEWKSK